MIRFGECFDLGEELENWVDILFFLFLFFFLKLRGGFSRGIYVFIFDENSKEEGYDDEIKIKKKSDSSI